MSNQIVLVPSQTIGVHYSCKAELARFLGIELKAFLPDHRTITIYFQKAIMSGAKK